MACPGLGSAISQWKRVTIAAHDEPFLLKMARALFAAATDQLKRLSVHAKLTRTRMQMEPSPRYRWALLVIGMAADSLQALTGIFWQISVAKSARAVLWSHALLRYILDKFSTRELVHMGGLLRTRGQVQQCWRGMTVTMTSSSDGPPKIDWAILPARASPRTDGKTVISDAAKEARKREKRRNKSTSSTEPGPLLLPYGQPFPAGQAADAEYFRSQEFLEEAFEAAGGGGLMMQHGLQLEAVTVEVLKGDEWGSGQ